TGSRLTACAPVIGAGAPPRSVARWTTGRTGAVLLYSPVAPDPSGSRSTRFPPRPDTRGHGRALTPLTIQSLDADHGAEAGHHREVQDARRRFRITGGADRPPHREDQLPHRALQGPQARPRVAPRAAAHGRAAAPPAGLSESDEGRALPKGGQGPGTSPLGILAARDAAREGGVLMRTARPPARPLPPPP